MNKIIININTKTVFKRLQKIKIKVCPSSIAQRPFQG